jgi:hypothetical protein
LVDLPGVAEVEAFRLPLAPFTGFELVVSALTTAPLRDGPDSGSGVRRPSGAFAGDASAGGVPAEPFRTFGPFEPLADDDGRSSVPVPEATGTGSDTWLA